MFLKEDCNAFLKDLLKDLSKYLLKHFSKLFIIIFMMHMRKKHVYNIIYKRFRINLERSFLLFFKPIWRMSCLVLYLYVYLYKAFISFIMIAGVQSYLFHNNKQMQSENLLQLDHM